MGGNQRPAYNGAKEEVKPAVVCKFAKKPFVLLKKTPIVEARDTSSETTHIDTAAKSVKQPNESNTHLESVVYLLFGPGSREYDMV